jgi:tellurite resistance protein TerC
VLMFVGMKMLVEHWYEIPIGLSLGVVGLLLGGSVVISLLHPEPTVEPTIAPDQKPN